MAVSSLACKEIKRCSSALTAKKKKSDNVSELSDKQRTEDPSDGGTQATTENKGVGTWQ